MTRRTTFWLALSLFLVTTLLLSACNGPKPSIDWKLDALSTPGATPQLYRIAEVEGTSIPTRPVTQTLDLLILGCSSDYGSESLDTFYGDVKPFMHEVFGAPNILGDTGSYAAPFSYYVTDHKYPQPTPMPGNTCNPGLPASWAPSTPNTPVNNLPAWDCNIALSTAGISLNLGFIVHRVNVQDSNKFNMFSSEYNSYAAILHELSHAAFVMSDEAPTGAGRFLPDDHPNIYLASNCNGVCSGNCGSISNTIYRRCVPTPSPTADATNVMYFYPQPTPGDNSTWNDYQYYFGSVQRLQYIYTTCANGGC